MGLRKREKGWAGLCISEEWITLWYFIGIGHIQQFASECTEQE